MKVVDALLGLLVLAVVSLCSAAEVSTSTVYHYTTTTATATLHREYCSCDAISTQRVSAPPLTTSSASHVNDGQHSGYSYSAGLKPIFASSSMTKATGPSDTYTSAVDSLIFTTTAFATSTDQVTTFTMTSTMSRNDLTSHSIAAATSRIDGGSQQTDDSSSAAPYVQTSTVRTGGTSPVTPSGSVVDLPEGRTPTSLSESVRVEPSLSAGPTSLVRSDTMFASSQISPAKTSATQSTTASQDLDASVSSFVVPRTSTSQSSSFVAEPTSSARSDTTFSSSQVSPLNTSETQSTTASQDLDVSVSSFVVPRTSTSTSQSSPRSPAQHSSLPLGVSTSATLCTSVVSSVIGRTSPVSTSVGNMASIQPPTVATQQPTSMLSEVSSTSAPGKGTPLPNSITLSMSVTRSTMGLSSAAQSAVVSNVDWPRSFPFLRTTAVVSLATLTTASPSPTSHPPSMSASRSTMGSSSAAPSAVVSDVDWPRSFPFLRTTAVVSLAPFTTASPSPISHPPASPDPFPIIVGRPVNLFWQPIEHDPGFHEIMEMNYTSQEFATSSKGIVGKLSTDTSPGGVFYASIKDQTICTDRGNFIGFDKSQVATGARLHYDDGNKTLTTNEFIITNGSVGEITVPDCTIIRNVDDQNIYSVVLTKNLGIFEHADPLLGKSKTNFLNLPDLPNIEILL